MGDDLTDMGISATAAAAIQVVLAHHPEHPLGGCHDRPEAEPRPCGVPRPPRGMPPGRPRWPPAEPRPRSGLLPGFHGVERGTGKTPGRTDPLEAVGQTRAGRGGGTHRRDLRRLGLQQFHLHDQLPDPLHGDVQFRLHRIALAFLERGIDPGDRLLTIATKVPPARHAKAAGQPHACASPSLAKSQRKRGRAKALVYHRPINSNFVLKIVGHVPVLLGHFD